ncbi:SDR family NAD(P)-dependent oxidoreductase [Conexibacter arvalis]|uniref:NAD(P)-dependent dehydrogenase (Short-subunit alcohol dehydrogenase family) n=1 Tax=Conexibacter arvalis TaxID=912552 RepID=A0A840IEU3_9ACTN|nr:SDR family oxidoreductase [Conexibacter arvalis]MBB4662835.1 NAD(P)-dependent dehydrogenase (short-subunit alcohol dehydrogenase family) [Conexibacter arvalis]
MSAPAADGGGKVAPRFDGRVALVVGGSLGIGLAAAERLAAEGARVVLGGHDAASVEAAVETVAAAAPGGSGAVAGVAGDVRDDGFAEALLAAARERFGGLDVFVYSAGVQRYGTLEATDRETWEEVFDVNVGGIHRVGRLALPALRERGGGAVVLVSSVQATASQQGVAAYAASKGAISTLTRAMALDHAAEGIRVNAVAPGSVDTPMLRWAADLFKGGETADAMVAQWGSTHPLGRVATTAEVAAAIAYLASDDAAFVTGAELRVDGGLLAKAAVELPR